MRDLLTNYALIITAILSLIGVSIAAILNYCSNIKTNKLKILSEEKRAKLPYLNDAFHILLNVYKELNKIDHNFNTVGALLDRDSTNEYLQTCYKALEKIVNIEPYLMKTDRVDLITRYNDLRSRIEEVEKYRANISVMTEKEYIDKSLSVCSDVVKLKFDFKKVLSKELSIISDALRDQIGIG